MKKKMKKNSFAPILIILILAILGVVGYFIYQGIRRDVFVSSTNSEKQEIILEENGSIYTYNLRTSQKTKLSITGLAERMAKEDPKAVHPSDLSLSPDKNDLYFNIDSDPFDFYIYNFSTKQTKILNNLGPSARPIQFSPNGKYAILDTGCCPGNRGRILITVDGNLIDRDEGTDFAWSPDSSSYALSEGDVHLSALEGVFGPAPDNSSVYIKKINGSNVTSQKIFNADYQHSYSVVSWPSIDSIIIKRNDYSQPFPESPTLAQENDKSFNDHWEKVFENAKSTFFSYNLTDKSTVDVTAPADNAINHDQTISSDGKLKITVDINHPKNGQSSYSTIYLSTVDGSNKTKIGDGYDAIWR